MVRIALQVFSLLFMLQPVFAQELASTKESLSEAQAIEVVLRGILVDNMYVASNKEILSEFVNTHSRECVSKPECLALGYSLFADGVCYELDDASNAKVIDFLKSPGNDLTVRVEGLLVNGKLTIKSMAN